MFIFALFITSCSENTGDDNVEFLSDKEKKAKVLFDERVNYYNSLDRKVVVEHSTIEELNALMIENGLSVITPEEIDNAARLKTTFPCQAWINLGDVSGNGTLSGQDLVLVRRWMCDHSKGCSGTYDLFGDEVTYPYDNFAFMSGLHTNSGWWDLNSTDVFAASAFILNNNTCN